MLSIDTLRKEGGTPKYNGLGMVRLRVGQYGLLFYSELAPPINHTIHNHRYSFTSKVLKGTIRNYLYEYDVVDKSDYMLTQKDMVNKVDTIGTIIHDNVSLRNVCTFDTHEGDSYFMDQRTFHHVERVTNTLITQMDPSPLPWNATALFLIEKDIPYVGVYSEPKSPEECWEIIEYTIRH